MSFTWNSRKNTNLNPTKYMSKNTHGGKREVYSAKQDAEILLAKNTDFPALATQYGRTVTAVAARQRVLKKKSLIPQGRKNRSYTDDECNTLLKMPSNIMAGIALGRTTQAVSIQRSKLVAAGRTSVEVQHMSKKKAMKALKQLGFFKTVAKPVVQKPAAQKPNTEEKKSFVSQPKSSTSLCLEINGHAIEFESIPSKIQVNGNKVSVTTK